MQTLKNDEGDKEADVSSISSTMSKMEETSCDNEIRQDKFQSPPCSSKTDASLSEEDISIDQINNIANETREACTKLSETLKCNKEMQTTFLHNTLSNNNDGDSNYINISNVKESKEDAHTFKLNGEHHSEKAESEETNDNVKTSEKTGAPFAGKPSAEHGFKSTHQQQSSGNIQQDENSQCSLHSELREENLDSQMVESEAKNDREPHIEIDEIDTDNCNNINSHEKIREYQNENSMENVYENKTSCSLSPPLKTTNDKDEASRSSFASSTSYSSDTSSSQHLVIDHPMDDIKEEKVKPLKISLKENYHIRLMMTNLRGHVQSISALTRESISRKLPPRSRCK
ncbi:hypothetical protein EVAR_70648_1 [Eumeta japonica]|uniref:Uncharacterized protein n=1 Tax=Eumeta variegata TaxID=151549 RepID=A0A4C1SAB5_EUMVA|nr:hypothetical protein EVAR_70648_1 [Eumeta japonica]